MCALATLPVGVSSDFSSELTDRDRLVLGHIFTSWGLNSVEFLSAGTEMLAATGNVASQSNVLLNIFGFLLTREYCGMFLFTEGCWEGSDTLRRH